MGRRMIPAADTGSMRICICAGTAAAVSVERVSGKQSWDGVREWHAEFVSISCHAQGGYGHRWTRERGGRERGGRVMSVVGTD